MLAVEKARLAKTRAKVGGELKDYIIEENLQCQFNPNSFRMIFVTNSENVIYLKGALKRARQVSFLVELMVANVCIL